MLNYFYEIDLSTDFVDKDKICKNLVDQHLQEKSFKPDYRHTTHNFKVNTDIDYFENLYDNFEKICHRIFKDLKVSERNDRACWAYVSNESDHSGKDVIHNHLLTSTINGVYYLKVPESCSGSVSFFNQNKQEIFSYQPKENFLIIFPNHQNHCANVSNTKEYRISINLELTCV